MSKLRILVSGGGSGGHLVIAQALANTCKEFFDFEVFYIGSTAGQDRKWFEDSELFQKSYFLPTIGVVNKSGFGKISSLFHQFTSTIKALKILKTYKIDAVICVGGFSAAPAALAAKLSRTPLYIHEQNASSGTLNRLLMPYSTRSFASFASSFAPNAPSLNLINQFVVPQKSDKFIITPYPINDGLKAFVRLRKDIKTIAFLGGSQGAKSINDLAINLAPILIKKGYKIIHQCGKNDLKRMQDFYKNLDTKNIQFFDFDEKLHNTLQNADLCICRSGASSVFENASIGLPSIYIPYPYATYDHQFFNAKYFADKNLGATIKEKDLNSDAILSIISELSTSNGFLKEIENISAKLIEISNFEGSKMILEIIKTDLNEVKNAK